jgi:hypothetical protein
MSIITLNVNYPNTLIKRDSGRVREKNMTQPYSVYTKFNVGGLKVKAQEKNLIT